MFDLVVRCEPNPDIAIEGETIVETGHALPAGKRELNAQGLAVLPGLIDVHLHFNEPGRTEWEGAATGSRALAAGGGTLFFDMPLNSSPCTIGPAEFDLKRRALEQTSITDFALWGGIIPGNLNALAELAERGVIGYKAFMCNSGLPEFPRADDLTLYEGMREAARLKLPVAVHAENEEIARGVSRPVIAEVEAIQRAGLLAREARCKLHIVHISSGRGVAAALEARAAGTDISIETCPHYLMFTEDDLLRIGALAKCAPPLRSQPDRNELLACVRRGDVDIIASDHSPCPPEMKSCPNFADVWGGIAGVQWTRGVLFEQGLDAAQIASLTALNGARRFKIRHKGTIEVGQHADLAIIDTGLSTTVSENEMFQRHYQTPYMGLTLRSQVIHTIRRGEIIYSKGAITAKTNGKLVRPCKA